MEYSFGTMYGSSGISSNVLAGDVGEVCVLCACVVEGQDAGPGVPKSF